MKKFLLSNILYLLWFVIYFTVAWQIVGGDLRSFIIVSVIYAISITIALSPIGEAILRMINGCRRPATEEEKNYLLPLFEEVYESAKLAYPNLSNVY